MSKKFNKIKKWLEGIGYTLKLSNVDQVDYNTKQVSVNACQIDKRKVFSLLHECGHIIVSSKVNYDIDFKVLNHACYDGRVMRSDVYKYKQLREEIEAWEHGYLLAEKLSIKVDKDEYDKYAAKCFKTYVKFYAFS